MKLNAKTKRLIEAATVTTLEHKGRGQGMLVYGEYILTASHNISFDVDTYMSEGDVLVTIETKKGLRFRASIIGVDPVTDIAILGEADYQRFNEDSDKYQEFISSTKPVRIRTKAFQLKLKPKSLSIKIEKSEEITQKPDRPPITFTTPLDLRRIKEFDVYILSHDGHWITGKGTGIRKSQHLPLVDLSSPIPPGTSGGPVVDAKGELVGVVSMGSGLCPRVCYTLPVYFWEDILSAQKIS